MNNEDIFKKIASKYVEQDGQRLKEELKQLYKDDTKGLDNKLKKTLKQNKNTPYLLYTAASFVILFVSVSLFSVFNKPNVTTKNPDVILLGAKLPVGYEVKNIKQDKAKTIYLVENETNNKIVLTVEQKEQISNLDELKQINIKDHKVYTLIKDDFNYFTFKKDNMTYTITSKYDYKDLIFICENIL